MGLTHKGRWALGLAVAGVLYALAAAPVAAQTTSASVFGQVKDAARGMADDAYNAGAEMVSTRPGSALLAAGIIGFALGVIFTRGSQPPRRSRWQRLYDLD